MGIVDRIIGTPRDRFAREALRIARRAPGMISVRYDRVQFAIAGQREGERSPVWIYLSNVYAECAGASRAERRDRIERLVRIMADPPGDDSWESVRDKLRPVLRPVTFGQAGAAGMKPLISRSALPFLRELVVVDHPESMAYIGASRVEAWGITVDEVFAAARANLAPIADASGRREWPGRDTLVRMVDTGDGYFVSHLLAPGWLAAVSERMGGRAIAFVPDTNTVIVATVPDSGVAPLYELVAAEYGEAVRSLSPVGYVTDDHGRVVPYRPPAGDPDHIAARLAETVLAATEYGSQQRWLNQQYEEGGIDVFVASLLALAKPGEPAITVATWSDGVDTLLPQAQYIAFVGEGGTGPRVPWSVVADRVDLQPEPLLAPARYRVSAWPPPEVMADLAAHDES